MTLLANKKEQKNKKKKILNRKLMNTRFSGGNDASDTFGENQPTSARGLVYIYFLKIQKKYIKGYEDWSKRNKVKWHYSIWWWKCCKNWLTIRN